MLDIVFSSMDFQGYPRSCLLVDDVAELSYLATLETPVI